ncbi:hypothetical protein F511_24396 [Dorcoceras hygrometricum]|uniref:Uncharacterized protein n=1 Tax=Dorcoceras hygrometricum TaxID=472368 RepID=A0A2Z7AYG4_9LAMI|nr:hypothetical protein F511_24396 [Dorcoceras hygrometricum]
MRLHEICLLLNHKEITLLFVYGSSDINILHLPFFRSGNDPLEDLIYTSCTDPIQQPAAARNPRLYTSPWLCQSLVLRLNITFSHETCAIPSETVQRARLTPTQINTVNHNEITLLFVYGSSDINILHLPFFRSGKDPLEDLIYTSCTDPIQQPATARTPRLYTSPRLCQSLVLRLFHSRITVLCSTADSADVKVADPPVVSTADPDFLLLQLLLLLSSTIDQTSHFRMRPVLFPPKWSNEQDSLLRNITFSHETCAIPSETVQRARLTAMQ